MSANWHSQADSGLPGKIEPIDVGNPSAGSQFSYTVADGTVALVRGLTFLLTCSGVAANRVPFIRFKNAAGKIVWQTSFSTPLIASDAVEFSLVLGIPAWDSVINETFYCCLPDLPLLENYIIESNFSQLQAADQFSLIHLELEIWRIPNV